MRQLRVKFCHTPEVSDQMSLILQSADSYNGVQDLPASLDRHQPPTHDQISAIVYYRLTQPNLKRDTINHFLEAGFLLEGFDLNRCILIMLNV